MVKTSNTVHSSELRLGSKTVKEFVTECRSCLKVDSSDQVHYY